MKKAKHPTSKYSVACDHFDTFASAEIHEADHGFKLKLTLESESGGEPLSLSLYREDVKMFRNFLQSVEYNITKRSQDEVDTM